ncbi:MAG: hypothetical protein J6B85_03635 [Lachnospiraceae bacterium]|nr:hypothetical protein [Lachnospiraceae bacterium]
MNNQVQKDGKRRNDQGERQLASKEQLLASIRPDMRLTREFFLKVYGYGLHDKVFLNEALQHLTAAGCAKAYDYYIAVVREYEQRENEELRRASVWYGRHWQQLYKVQIEEVKQGCRTNRTLERMEDLHQKSDRELLSLLASLKKDAAM